MKLLFLTLLLACCGPPSTPPAHDSPSKRPSCAGITGVVERVEWVTTKEWDPSSFFHAGATIEQTRPVLHFRDGRVLALSSINGVTLPLKRLVCLELADNYWEPQLSGRAWCLLSAHVLEGEQPTEPVGSR